MGSMVVLVNPQTGKEFRISSKSARSFFGANGINKKFLCLPCYSEIQLREDPTSLQFYIKKYKRKKKVSGTCVIRMGGLGDLILLSSGLQALKKRMKGEPLTFATLKTHQSFMHQIDSIDQCITVDELGGYEFDKVIDLRFAVEPPQLGAICKGTWDSYTTEDRSDVFDKLLGVYPAPKRFSLPVDDKATKKMAGLVPETFILINACMIAAARSIVSKYILPLCGLITKKLHIPVVLVGVSQTWNMGLKAISMPNVINLIDKTNISEMISLCHLSDLVVTPDTSTVHIAGAMGKRAIGLFGNINPRTRISYYPNVRALYPHGKLSCIPCHDLHPCMADPNKSPKCMELLTPDVIFNAIEQEYSGVKQCLISQHLWS